MRQGDAAGEGGDVDDRAALLPEVGERGPGEHDGPAQVHVHHLPETLGVVLVEVAPEVQPGVVHDDVEASLGAHRLVDDAQAVAHRGHVGDDVAGAPPGVADAARHLLEGPGVPGDEDHVGALPGEPARRRLADAGGRTGDDRDLPREATHAQSFRALRMTWRAPSGRSKVSSMRSPTASPSTTAASST